MRERRAEAALRRPPSSGAEPRGTRGDRGGCPARPGPGSPKGLRAGSSLAVRAGRSPGSGGGPASRPRLREAAAAAPQPPRCGRGAGGPRLPWAWGGRRGRGGGCLARPILAPRAPCAGSRGCAWLPSCCQRWERSAARALSCANVCRVLARCCRLLEPLLGSEPALILPSVNRGNRFACISPGLKPRGPKAGLHRNQGRGRQQPR